MSSDVTKDSSLYKPAKLHYLLVCIFFICSNVLINLLNVFFKCTFCYLVYVSLLSIFISFFLLSLLHSSIYFIILSLSSPLFPLSWVLPYIFCTTCSRLLYWIFTSFLLFPFPFFLYLPFFSICLHVPTRTHVNTHTQGSKWSGCSVLQQKSSPMIYTNGALLEWLP
jgi:hypothetical protein